MIEGYWHTAHARPFPYRVPMYDNVYETVPNTCLLLKFFSNRVQELALLLLASMHEGYLR